MRTRRGRLKESLKRRSITPDHHAVHAYRAREERPELTGEEQLEYNSTNIAVLIKATGHWIGGRRERLVR